MFSVIPCADGAVIEKLCKECDGVYRPEALLNMVLIVDGELCGVSQMVLTGKTIRLVFAGVKQSFRKKGYGDLVMRSAINKAIPLAEIIEVESVHSYFKKFGFVSIDGIYRANSSEIVFPSYCGHCK